MTASLLTIFVDAMEAERTKYAVGGDHVKSAVWLRLDQYGRIGKENLCLGTPADCHRFIAEQCARKGFAAVLRETRTHMPYCDTLDIFLKQLIGDDA